MTGNVYSNFEFTKISPIKGFANSLKTPIQVPKFTFLGY